MSAAELGRPRPYAMSLVAGLSSLTSIAATVLIMFGIQNAIPASPDRASPDSQLAATPLSTSATPDSAVDSQPIQEIGPAEGRSNSDWALTQPANFTGRAAQLLNFQRTLEEPASLPNVDSPTNTSAPLVKPLSHLEYRRML